jgi:hypothetical protein
MGCPPDRFASESLGAAAFIDIPALRARLAEKSLADELRKLIFKHIRNGA